MDSQYIGYIENLMKLISKKDLKVKPAVNFHDNEMPQEGSYWICLCNIDFHF